VEALLLDSLTPSSKRREREREREREVLSNNLRKRKNAE
jgi:hypothetical protein